MKQQDVCLACNMCYWRIKLFAHTKDLMSILEPTVPAGWKVWGHSTDLITFSPLMLAGSTSMRLMRRKLIK
ncbi:hypothetical protein Pyn_07966 [Prunus yedoensis var. nudiflora]|uniref:Uncharacterized protein n=1 Tax=Prunus yedoensis var. nudiflora TaxID=2094558 RepID=A0A314YMG9_PRUYE|nr:hypothetical protein Pyn_07966 [Prunus yedoensis var. nudiflora]